MKNLSKENKDSRLIRQTLIKGHVFKNKKIYIGKLIINEIYKDLANQPHKNSKIIKQPTFKNSNRRR